MQGVPNLKRARGHGGVALGTTTAVLTCCHVAGLARPCAGVPGVRSSRVELTHVTCLLCRCCADERRIAPLDDGVEGVTLASALQQKPFEAVS